MYATAEKAPSYFLSAASGALIVVYVSGTTVLVQAVHSCCYNVAPASVGIQ